MAIASCTVSTLSRRRSGPWRSRAERSRRAKPRAARPPRPQVAGCGPVGAVNRPAAAPSEHRFCGGDESAGGGPGSRCGRKGVCRARGQLTRPETGPGRCEERLTLRGHHELMANVDLRASKPIPAVRAARLAAAPTAPGSDVRDGAIPLREPLAARVTLVRPGDVVAHPSDLGQPDAATGRTPMHLSITAVLDSGTGIPW